MNSMVTAAAIAFTFMASACAGNSSGSSEYRVEDEDAVIIRGAEPAAVPSHLELRGILRYDTESRCFLVEIGDSDNTDTIRQTLVWHQEAHAEREGDRIGVTVEADTGDRVTLWDGDVLAGAFESANETLDDIDACAADGVTNIYNVSAISQDQLQKQYERISQLGDPPG